MAKNFKSLKISNQFKKYECDSRVEEFLKNVEPGAVTEQISMNPAPAVLMPPAISPMRFQKRPMQMSNEDILAKRRRSSINYINTFSNNSNEDALSQLSSHALNEGTLMAYQQLYGNRRHSFQPLTSFQEQQFAFYHSNPSMLSPNNIHFNQAGNSQFQPQSPLGTYPQVKREKTDRSMSTPFIYNNQLTPQSNNMMRQPENNQMQLSPTYPETPASEKYANNTMNDWQKWTQK